MILIVTGDGTSTGKTTLARSLSNSFSSVRIFDDMSLPEVQDQRKEIEFCAANFSLTIVIIDAKVGQPQMVVLHNIISEWQLTYPVSMVRTLPLR